MATLVENAVRIKQTFDDIYDAIVEKGVTPAGGVDTYAEAIDEILVEGEPLNRILYCNSNTAYTSKTSAVTITQTYTATQDSEVFIITNTFYSTRYGGTLTDDLTIGGVSQKHIYSQNIFVQSYMYWRTKHYSQKVKKGDVIKYTARISAITGNYTTSWDSGMEIVGET